MLRGTVRAQRPAAQPPPVEPPTRYKNAPVASAPHPAPPGDGAWWGIFHDATLDALERNATGTNQDLRQAVARIDEARQQTRTAYAGFLPTVESNLGAARVRTSNSNPIERAELVGNAGAFGAVLGAGGNNGQVPAFASRVLSATYSDYRLPLSFSYEIDVFGRLRHAYASAKAVGEAASADRQAVALGLSAEIARQYFGLRALDSRGRGAAAGGWVCARTPCI